MEGGREGREEKEGSIAWDEGEYRKREGETREKEGEQGAEGWWGREMGVHANFIILLINFSSSNPPAGT